MGSTQNYLKKRMAGHFSDIANYFRTGGHTDTFARHMIRHFDKKPTHDEIRRKCSFKVLKKVSPFSFTKGIRSHDCRLCLAKKWR